VSYDGPGEWEARRPGGPHIWRTLGFRLVASDDEQTVLEWDASDDYTFPTEDGPIVHGGLVTTLLDTAMGFACVRALGDDGGFLTADLNVEFFRVTRPGTLRAEGRVTRRTRRVVFCAAELTDAEGNALARGRCTQIVREPRAP
jgi:uncharacterized protein (TIGR00369 family)